MFCGLCCLNKRQDFLAFVFPSHPDRHIAPNLKPKEFVAEWQSRAGSFVWPTQISTYRPIDLGVQQKERQTKNEFAKQNLMKHITSRNKLRFHKIFAFHLNSQKGSFVKILLVMIKSLTTSVETKTWMIWPDGSYPTAPVAPVAPMRPGFPGNPVAPIGPKEPGGPLSPTGPAGPTKPLGPTICKTWGFVHSQLVFCRSQK